MTSTTHRVSISFQVPCEFYEMNHNKNIKLTKHVPLTPELLSELYASIRLTRTRFRYGDANNLGTHETFDKFVSDDFGIVHIEQEQLDFNYTNKKKNKGILKVSYVLAVNVSPALKREFESLGKPVFNEDIISGLIYDAFNPSYSDKGIVDVAQFDMVLEVMDTPQQVKFQVSGDAVLDEMEANQSESEEEEEY